MQTLQNNSPAFEPSVESIRDEMRRASLTFDDARESLIRSAKASAKRIVTAIPSASSKIQDAQTAAAEAIQRAEAVKENQEQVVYQVESMLRALGEVTLKIKAVNELVLTPDGKVGIQDELIRMHIQASEQPSPIIEASLNNWCQGYLLRSIVQDRIPSVLKPLLEQSEKLVSEIKSFVRREKVNLAGLIQILAQEPASQEKFSSYLAADSFAGLFESTP